MSNRVNSRRGILMFAAGMACLFAWGPASSHHSTAEFDYGKTVILHGTIKEVQC
jgi:hypothetical protein